MTYMAYDWARLADYIRAEMARRQWSREQLADEASIGKRTVNRLVSGQPHTRMPSALPKLEVAFGWEPGTARKILLGAAPDGQLSREQIQREYDDILARAMKLDPYHRRRIALYIAAQELAEDEE